MTGYRAFAAFLTAILVLSDGVARSAEGIPAFEYTAQIQNEIVLPILQRELGSGLVRYYDPAHPRISWCDGITLLFQFDSSKLARGEEILDPPYVIIALDPRTLAVQSVSTRPSYVIGPPPLCGVTATPPTISP